MRSNTGNFVNVIRNGESIFVPFENIKAGDTVLLHNSRAERFTAEGDTFLHDYVQSVSGVAYKKSDVIHYREDLVLFDPGEDLNEWIVSFETAYPGFDVITAAREAAIDFCNTERGRAICKQLNGFTWSDFIRFIPSEFCEAHGFCIEETGKRQRAINTTDYLVMMEDGDFV